MNNSSLTHNEFWVKVQEGDAVWYEHPELGNIFVSPDGLFICAYPKIISIGPFETLDKAKMALDSFRGSIDNSLNAAVTQLVDDSKNW